MLKASNILVACGLLCLIASWFDSVSRPRLRGIGTVTQKSYTPKRRYNQWISHAQYGGHITTYYTPESYDLRIEIDTGSDWVSVSESFYRSAYEGRLVRIAYCTGRFSERIYVKDISSWHYPG